MRSIPNGEWSIDFVLINEETVMNNEGFRSLIVTDESIVVMPAGIAFDVKQSTENTAVLDSQKQVFYAEFAVDNDALSLELTRQKFRETVRIVANLVPAFVSGRKPMSVAAG